MERARIVLAAADGRRTVDIARALGTRPARVSKWRTRFARERLAALTDAPRPGARRKYDRATERRILAKLHDPPPEGHATWTEGLLAAALGDVTDDEVWRVMRRQGIHLRRRHSWCVTTDPEFAPKAADIVGLYLDPPENRTAAPFEWRKRKVKPVGLKKHYADLRNLSIRVLGLQGHHQPGALSL